MLPKPGWILYERIGRGTKRRTQAQRLCKMSLCAVFATVGNDLLVCWCCVVLLGFSYLRLETKSHELSSIYRGMAARLEDMQAAAQQQQSSEVDAPREQLVREEAEAAESRRRSAVQALQLEKEGQATKWRELLSAIERENELQLEAMLLQHKEAVDSGIRSITQHIAGPCLSGAMHANLTCNRLRAHFS